MWGDRFRTAADLALAGTVVTVAALPVVTAGAAFTAGSFAMNHFVQYETWPSPRATFEVFRRRLWPSLLAGPAVAAAAGLVWLDVWALHRGAVPGGPLVIAVVLLAAAVAAGYLGLAVVRAGRPATRPVTHRPGVVAAAAGVVALIGLLALLVHPVLLPALVGYALFALHAVVARDEARQAVVARDEARQAVVSRDEARQAVVSRDEALQGVVAGGAGHPEHEAAGQGEHLVHR